MEANLTDGILTVNGAPIAQYPPGHPKGEDALAIVQELGYVHHGRIPEPLRWLPDPAHQLDA